MVVTTKSTPYIHFSDQVTDLVCTTQRLVQSLDIDQCQPHQLKYKR